MSNLLNIHWLAVRPTPYNDFLFRKLFADPEINLTVYFIDRASKSHPWRVPMAQGFTSRYYQKFLGFDWQLINLAVKDTRSFFVIAGWDEPVRQAIINLLMFRGRPFAIWTDTPNLNARRHPLKSALRASWLKMVFRRATAVLATGTPGINALEKMGCNKDKVYCFPYWVPVPSIESLLDVLDSNNDFLHSNNPIRFFAAGRLVKRKGYGLLIDACARITKSEAGKKIALFIAGDGPERNFLQKLIASYGLEETVQLLGWQDHESVIKNMILCDVFVHPALWEPYGVVVLEAMAHGKPVIGSDKTMAAVDRISHGINGFVHKTGNVEEIANQMNFFLRNPDKIDRMGREARRISEEWQVERGVEIIKGLAQQGFA